MIITVSIDSPGVQQAVDAPANKFVRMSNANLQDIKVARYHDASLIVTHAA